ncbi:MAG: hypothetical protein GXO26_02785 [Crenarchaeota archaeon]|nr:hypothetical protein [Thermoproteota archaeon]
MTVLEEKLASIIMLTLNELPRKELDRLIMILLLARYSKPLLQGRKIVEYCMFIGSRLVPIVPADFYIVENRVESPDILAILNRLIQSRFRTEVDDSTLHILTSIRDLYKVTLPKQAQDRIRKIVRKYGKRDLGHLWKKVAKVLGLDPSRKYPPLKVDEIIQERRLVLVRKVLH